MAPSSPAAVREYYSTHYQLSGDNEKTSSILAEETGAAAVDVCEVVVL